jgi:hypothetical protein
MPSGVNQGSAWTSSNWTRAGANGSLEKSGTRLITRFIGASPPRETTIFHAKTARLSLPARTVTQSCDAPRAVQMVAIPRILFADILRLVSELRHATGGRIDVKRLLILSPIKNQGRGASR